MLHICVRKQAKFYLQTMVVALFSLSSLLLNLKRISFLTHHHSFIRYAPQMEQFFDHNGIFVHFSMFLNYLNSHADDDQKKYWNAQARQGNYIAAYAQTELGHGSNVRGLENAAFKHKNGNSFTYFNIIGGGLRDFVYALVFAQLMKFANLMVI